MPTVQIHNRQVEIQRFTLRKAMRVITLLGIIEKQIPEFTRLAAEYRREYRAANVLEMDRAQARLEYGERPVVDENGNVVFREDGSVATLPSLLDSMSEQDWERSGQKLRFHQSPSGNEVLLAVFPQMYEQAEQPILRLLALVAMSNDDVTKYVADGTIWDEVDRFAEEVIAPALLEEVMELAVAAAEEVEGQVMQKAQKLEGRLGKLLAAFGRGTPDATPTAEEPSPPISPTSSEPLESPSIESSTASQSDTTGPIPSESEVSPGTPSTTSAPSLTSTAN